MNYLGEFSVWSEAFDAARNATKEVSNTHVGWNSWQMAKVAGEQAAITAGGAFQPVKDD